MKRYHILKDGQIQASTASKQSAIDLIRIYQAKETHQFLKANFSIIVGEEEQVSYRKE